MRTEQVRSEKFSWILAVVFTLMAIFGTPSFLFAAPPASPYAPGETLDPSCSPGASNCTVEQIYVSTTTLNYGIGTTSPFARFSIAGTSTAQTALFAISTSTASATSTALIIDGNGRVGIGMTSLSNQLSVNGTSYFVGNMGIGTTSPYAKLSVVGEVVARNFTATSTTATSTFMGAVGIGTTTPVADLHVDGSIYILGGDGDVNGSGTVLVNDSLLILNHLAGTNILTPAQLAHADIDGDGRVTYDDVYMGLELLGAVGADKNTAILKSHALYGGGAGVFNIYPYGLSTASFSFSTVGNSYLNSGNIGIGTTSPYGLLSISTTTTPVIPLFVIATSSTSGTSTPFIVDRYGNVGVGTTSPWRTLSVNGTVAINGLTSNATANAVCILAGGEITTAGGAVCNGVSSQRFKHDIENADLGLSTILAMRPVSFRYNEGYGDSGKLQQFGLIAEDIYAIDPRLAVLDAGGLPTTVRYDFLAPLLIKAIQELNLKIEALASTSVTSAQNQNSLFALVVDWVGNSIQAVRGVFGKVETKELCVEDICVTREKFKAVFGGNVGVATPSSSTPSSSSTLYPLPSNNSLDSTPPTITIIGNNPADIEIDTPYLDLGATVDDNVDHNLGVHVTGAEIDTTIPYTYTVTYTATDQAGNTATSTRIVIVKESLLVVPPESSPDPLSSAEASTTESSGE